MRKKILLIDDEKALRDMVKAYLTSEGFEIVTARGGQEALYVARHEKPDLIILDLMMPEMSGYDFIRAYSQEAQTPIIILTAKLDESDKVLGLELGADDYVTKPFSLRELTARIRAMLRRLEKIKPDQALLRAGDIILDQQGRIVTVKGQTVDLTPTEFEILTVFMTSPGRAFSRLDLLDQLPGHEGYERTIDVHVRRLRTKIEADPSQPCNIETVYGFGYRFRAESY